MLVETGHFALILALAVACVQAVVPLYGAWRGEGAAMALARTGALVQFALVALAFLTLMRAFVVSDFSLALVFQNSHSAKPLLYKIAGVWGNHEGSMVLWVLILSFLGALVALFGANLPPTLRARVLAIQALIAVGFLAFILFTSNPFLRLDPAPMDGRDLNPLLQDPGLAFHPPLLYLGYVGFSVAFSFGIAALIEGRVDPAWARWVRPWTLLAWASLTLGIAMGSWWAYYELGWGGFWFWDPVENASLMPWLSGTALLHSAIVVEKRDTLKRWTILMAILTFSMSLLGTFLVRSGVLTSVHAFASDPARGLFILFLIVACTGGALALYAVRSQALRPGGVFSLVSRETALVLNNVILSVLLAAIFLGTLYPPLAKALSGNAISVGAPYFNLVSVPFAALLALMLAPGTMLPWKRGDLGAVFERLWPAIVLSLIVVLVAVWLTWGGPVLAVVGVAMGSWAILGALFDLAERLRLGRLPLAESLRRARGLPRSAFGTVMAHAGLGLVFLGIVGTTLFVAERIEVLRPGQSLDIAGYRLTFEGMESKRVANYETDMGLFSVWRDEKRVGELRPERRLYLVQRQPTTEAAILPRAASDLYLALGDPSGEDGWVVRAWHHPMVHLIWGGALLMALGGAISLTDRRYRVGAPARARRPLAQPIPQQAE